MLKLGGYINIIIAIAHIVGLFWADKMFEVTGIADVMALASQNIHPIYPYFLRLLWLFSFLYLVCTDFQQMVKSENYLL